jgi:NADH-quinone oxidoreductase subunit G
MTIDNTPVELVNLTIDDIEVQVPKGTLIIRAAEQLGVQVPRFCDHPLLDPVAACRACLVEIEGQPKPQPSCAITVAEGMKVRTQVSSPIAEEAQKGVMEFLLINHPLDCPVCDKGGECPLQNQAMTNGRGESRFDGQKREFEKPINISAQVLLDRERCVSCARCTRFADQVAGDPLIDLFERGAQQQVGISDDQPFDSYFSGNTIQICPVGALTSAKYRFRSRPFDLVSVPTTCEHCASGCSLRTDIRRGSVMRRLAWDDPQVNEEWNCDKGRFAFPYVQEGRLTTPLVRGEDGLLHPASWTEAIAEAAKGFAAANGSSAVLAGGRHTLEDAYAISKFARAVLGTDDVDFRARPHSTEETQFLSATISGAGLGVTYADLEKAAHVVLVAFEPEDESPMVQLRLRKAVRRGRTKVTAITSHVTAGNKKLNANIIATAAGHEVSAVAGLALDANTIILVGERAASVTGLLTAVSKKAKDSGAKLAWVPRRAGDRGAVDAGLLPGLLPNGNSLTDPMAREKAAEIWNVENATLPFKNGRDFGAIVHAANNGEIKALLITGVDVADTQHSASTVQAIENTPFVVSLEIRPSSVTELANVVLPVAVVTEKSGTFIDWEGRPRTFSQAIREHNKLTDARVLAMIADAMDVIVGHQDVAQLRAELAQFAAPTSRAAATEHGADAPNGLTLSTWNQLIDDGSLQEGEPFLAATSRNVIAGLHPDTAAAHSIAEGDLVEVSTSLGSICVEAVFVDGAENTIWLPTNSGDSKVRTSLGAAHGNVVTIKRGGGQ